MILSESLGYADDAKLLIIHADDAGLSHAENRATIAALKSGVVNSYSIMVPCPWFYEIAQFAKNNPQYDYGLHLTLTCEWEQYKFGPVLSQDQVSSLVDPHGFFFKDRQSVLNKATLDELRKELCAQIDRALEFGLQPTHLDSHMYTLGASIEFLDLYREIGEAYKLPVLLNSELISMVSGSYSKENNYGKSPFVDQIYLGNFEAFRTGALAGYYSNSLKSLKPGFNMILIHPAFNDPEMKSIAINHPNFGADWRQVDFDFFTSKACMEIIEEEKIQLITWKDIKALVYSKKTNSTSI